MGACEAEVQDRELEGGRGVPGRGEEAQSLVLGGASDTRTKNFRSTSGAAASH